MNFGDSVLTFFRSGDKRQWIKDLEHDDFVTLTSWCRDNENALLCLLINTTCPKRRWWFMHTLLCTYNPFSVEFVFRNTEPEYFSEKYLFDYMCAVVKECEEDFIVSFYLQQPLLQTSLYFGEGDDERSLVIEALRHGKKKVFEAIFSSPHNTRGTGEIMHRIVRFNDEKAFNTIVTVEDFSCPFYQHAFGNTTLYQQAFQGTGKPHIIARLFCLGLTEDAVALSVKSGWVHGSIILNINSIVKSYDREEGKEESDRFIEYYIEQNPETVTCVAKMALQQRKDGSCNALDDSVIEDLVRKSEEREKNGLISPFSFPVTTSPTSV